MYIELDNVEMFYEKRGSGDPLILLHGNAQSHAVFDEAVEVLEKHFTCYAPDSRGHGQTRYLNATAEQAARERRELQAKQKKQAVRGVLNYEDMADDIIQFIEKLGIKKPVIYGFSDGGIIALIVAAKKPELLKKIMVSSVNVEPDGIKDSVMRGLRIQHMITRSKKKKLLLDQPHISPDEMHRILIPTVVLVGEYDLIKREHLDYIVKNIPKCRLKVLKNETHTSYVIHNSKIADILIDFAS
ncbi:MAG: alpha/beta fold hydrolase [Anaerovoracaceae bacterium]|jgi:pimeloyl-ACP methyl ester carboxylesterase